MVFLHGKAAGSGPALLPLFLGFLGVVTVHVSGMATGGGRRAGTCGGRRPPAERAALPGLLKRGDAQLAGLRPDSVLDFGLGARLDRGVDPVAGARLEERGEEARERVRRGRGG